MASAQRGGVDAELGGHTWAQVVDEDVGPTGQALERRQAPGAFQVDRHRLLAAVEDLEVQRVAVPEGRAHLARIVAALDAFELDHLGAQVGQDGAGKRPGQHLAQLQHPHALQGA